MGQHRERFELARQQFSKAVDRLHEVVVLDETSIIRDSLIQRFEMAFELGWKCMFYWLRDHGEQVPEMVSPTISAAFRCEIIGDPELWEKIKDCRNETSHTYDEAKAIAVAAFVRSHTVTVFDALRARLETA
jgi:nucleotidyltransferase substrate binding protein (TIGR01987 family)